MYAQIKEELEKITGVDDSGKQDIFELAEGNNKFIEKQFDELNVELKLSAKEKYLESVFSIFNNWGLTVNMGCEKVFWECNNGKIGNTYDMAQAMSEREKVAFNVALEKICNKHYNLRIKFHKEIKFEECFKYTAFNLGNMGLQGFGEFCFYFENATAFGLKEVTFIKGNSLANYSDDDYNIDIGRLTTDISTKEFVKQLVSLKHKNEIENEIDINEWPDKTCNDICYVEGVVIDDLVVAEITHVNIQESYHLTYVKKGMDLRYYQDVSADETDLVSNYLMAIKSLEEIGIKILIK